MGGGTMHIDHLVPQLSNANKTLSSSCCNGQFCRKQEITSNGSLYNPVFETVPSRREVEDAISALQEFMKAVSTTIIDQQIADSYDYDSRIVHLKDIIDFTMLFSCCKLILLLRG
ncbi:hypothetical protein MTR_7g045270 [Medicago truncatula]|uniref:Uncharacterized protein n=1 Tax=Medicago truncatula TaxID=3880 RepID=G7KTZ3_MEDTR|nr:hypothetical protein MTR_7g045270 [Medicago truncatula]